MCHDSTVDSKEKTGAPGKEIKVTPDMIEAANKAVFATEDRFFTSDGNGYRLDDELLSLIFMAMTKKREE